MRDKLLHHTGHVVTAKNAWIAKQVSLVHVTVITLIGLYTLVHLVHSVHNIVGVHILISFSFLVTKGDAFPGCMHDK